MKRKSANEGRVKNIPGHGAQGVAPEACYAQAPSSPGGHRCRLGVGVLPAQGDDVRPGQRNRRQSAGLTATEVEEAVGTEVSTAPPHWPPIAHIAKKPVKEGGRALCGEKLMGIELDEAHEVCPECIKLWKEGKR